MIKKTFNITIAVLITEEPIKSIIGKIIIKKKDNFRSILS